MFPLEQVNETHDPLLAMANCAGDVFWGNEMALSVEEKKKAIKYVCLRGQKT